MIEQVYSLTRADARVTEPVLFDENLHYAHIVLPGGERVARHFSNSTVYMTVVRGTLSIGLGEQPMHAYPPGTLLKIPVDTAMDIQNAQGDTLELLVIKAPAPTGPVRQAE